MKPPCNSVLRLSVTLCLIVWGLNTNAQQSAAILIGISQYKEVTPLQFADRDAVAFAQFLKTQHVPEDNIKPFFHKITAYR